MKKITNEAHKAREYAKKIEIHFKHHNIDVYLLPTKIICSEERIIYQILLSPGTRAHAIFARAPDIQAALQLPLFRPFYDGQKICLAVSEKPVTENDLWKMLRTEVFQKNADLLPIAVGYDLMGRMQYSNIAEMPHALYAGSTNSGKSYGLVSIIVSLIYLQPVNRANLLIFDVGASTLDVFAGIPHLSHPIVKEIDVGVYVIDMLRKEMERRIELPFEELRNLPAIICVIDEYPSFISGIHDEDICQKVIDDITNLLSRGRKAKVHMILATQNPSVRIMSGAIGNITTRAAFKVPRYQNSIAILNTSGAEKLPGKGAMLYQPGHLENPMYIQGAYTPLEKVAEYVSSLKMKSHDDSRKFTIPDFSEVKQSEAVDEVIFFNIADKEFANIILWALGNKSISVDRLKKKFSMGNRANSIMDQLCEMGIVTEQFAKQPRKVLPQAIEDVPPDTLEFLQLNQISRNQIKESFLRRTSSKPR